MRRLTYGLNVSLDGYVSAPGDDLSWSEPSDELFEWWLHEEQAVSLLLYGRRLWEDMSAYWPARDQQPGTTPAQAAYAQNWRDTPKVVFSSSLAGAGGGSPADALGWDARLVSGDAVAEIARLKAGDGGLMRVAGATLGRSAVRAGLVDEYAVVTHPVVLGGGAPFFAARDRWLRLDLVETRTFSGGVVLTRYQTRR